MFEILLAVAYLFEHDMAVLSPAPKTDVQDHKMPLEVLGVVIVIMMFHRLPGNEDQIPILNIFDRFQYTSSHNSLAPVNMSHDVCPQWPSTLMPCSVSALVDGRADRIA